MTKSTKLIFKEKILRRKKNLKAENMEMKIKLKDIFTKNKQMQIELNEDKDIIYKLLEDIIQLKK